MNIKPSFQFQLYPNPCTEDTTKTNEAHMY